MTDNADDRAIKRIRTDDSAETPLNARILREAEELSESYKNAKPYAHGVIQDIFQTSFANNVLEEFKNNMKAKYKESDLFRVYQSIDLGNLDPNHKSNHELMPNVMRLREILYSQEYRSFIEKIANIEPGTLIDKVDCALNCHDKGCHLLCHDDVIGTRKVSYIFYLTDPEPDWTDEDGGRLELYDSITTTEEEMNGNEKCIVERKVPTCFPAATVLPKFNSFAYFVVEPGVSFHSVQEVFCDRPRLSLQGWYHAKEAPKSMEHATLNQLKCNTAKDMEGEFIPYSDKHNDGNLQSKDIEFLSKYINDTYLKEESIEQIRALFEEESSVQLRHFFKEDLEHKISKLLHDEDSRDELGGDKVALDYTVGITEDWIPQGPAHKQRFLQCKFIVMFQKLIQLSFHPNS
jgi:Rps23 Pro-64 3,4-dihydroxylase Tpa1-like proline 4-hydroxylase